MALSVLESFQFGGVSSRDNPLNMPVGRSLRLRNWQPKDNGELQLRYGFSTVSMSGSTSTAVFHSLIPYTFYDASGNETPYLLMGQGTNIRVLNISSGVVTSPSVRGAAIASSARDAYYLANGKVHFGNGTDQKWFDGVTVRDNGLRSLTALEVANVVLAFGVGSLTVAMNSSITITTAAGGTFGTTTVGILFYVSPFDVTVNELGPAPNFAGAGRINFTGSQKATIAGMPDFSTGSPNQYKLISRTGDGTAQANFCTNTSTAITSCTRSGTTLTVISPAHGLSSNDIVVNSGTTNFDGLGFITKIDNNTFTITLNQASGQNITGANTTGGTCKRVVSAAPATTSVDVTSTTQDTTILANDANFGVAFTAGGLTTPGYAFYASIYNPTADGHVGNRIAIGSGRISGTAPRYNVRITGLPDLSGTDSEWSILIGRTGDSAQIPYPCADSSDNWMHTAAGQTAITLTIFGGLDGTSELPIRNGVIPAGLNMFARSGERIFGGQIGRPTVYRSGSETDALTGNFVGRPEQSWAPNDIDTFPTAQGLTGTFDDPRGCYFGTKNDGAVFADLGTGFAWIGPWYGAGIAGARAWCDTPYGKYWITGHKQMATFDNGFPRPVSDEYEAALLSKIGDAFLSQVEMFHLRDISKRLDKIVIKALDINGVPFEVHHDFRLEEGRSPDGQGYESEYSSPLAADFVLTAVRDSGGAERLWAGANTGQLYQLETGANDAGTEFSADAVFLLNAGTARPSVPEFRWYGDQKVAWSLSRKLNGSLGAGDSTAFQVLTTEAVLDEDSCQVYFKALLPSTKLNKAYIRFQLTSHSVDGNLDLNDPPHCPLETYGRVYLSQGIVGMQQGV